MGSDAPSLTLSISAVERETGLSKDVLRVWERRYGFPRPGRDGNGERAYAAADVARLRTIKRLMDAGMRPGRIVHASQGELDAMASARVPPRGGTSLPEPEHGILAALRRHDAAGLQHALATLLMQQGLQKFVLESLTPLHHAIGDAWTRGELQIFEEHLYTEQLQVALRTAINAFPRATGTPRVLLTTFPGEQHALGLLMVEALLVPEGAQCISLGAQTPLADIRGAALAHGVDVVALSFSAVFPVRQATDGLAALRRQLPPSVTLWAGGEMTRRVRRALPGVELVPDLAASLEALASWRERWREATPAQYNAR